MYSPVRYFFILPIIFFSLIAVLQLAFGSLLSFVLWSFVDLAVFLICWPIVVKAKMKYVPIYQIFSLFLGTLAVLFVASLYDLKNFFPLSKAIVLAIFASLIIMGIFMGLHQDNS